MLQRELSLSAEGSFQTIFPATMVQRMRASRISSERPSGRRDRSESGRRVCLERSL